MSDSAPPRPSLPLRLALVGCGYWGRNLLRNLTDSAALFAAPVVCESSAERRADLAERHPELRVVAEFEGGVLASAEIGAVVIATPAGDHAAQVRAALEAGKHVLVEKPLALGGEEAAELVRLADARGLTLMVGHTFLYHAAVRRMREEIAAGNLGDIFYLTSERLAMGIVRADVDALWNLAPHDVSIANYVLGERPASVAAQGSAHLRPGVVDVAFLHLAYASGRRAHLHVSWLHPAKVREVMVVGRRGTMIFDDVGEGAKLRIHGWERDATKDRAERPDRPPAFDTFAEFQALRGVGAERVPPLDFREPLAAELEHFARCVAGGERPLTDGRNGYDVVATLEAASESLRRGGVAVPLAPALL